MDYSCLIIFGNCKVKCWVWELKSRLKLGLVMQAFNSTWEVGTAFESEASLT